jgi:hypothetical protein
VDEADEISVAQRVDAGVRKQDGVERAQVRLGELEQPGGLLRHRAVELRELALPLLDEVFFLGRERAEYVGPPRRENGDHEHEQAPPLCKAAKATAAMDEAVVHVVCLIARRAREGMLERVRIASGMSGRNCRRNARLAMR